MGYAHITADDVLREIRAVAAENPDYVYVNDLGQRVDESCTAKCKYVHHDGPEATPGCIVGHALYRLGVSLEDLQEDSTARRKLSALSIDARSDAAYDVENIQYLQDTGYTWGEAVEGTK